MTARATYEVILRAGEEELQRPAAALAWSALAAGLAMGLSFLTQAAVQAHLPDAAWAPLIVKFGYTIGFLVVILGSQLLFTETTLTAVIPVMAHRSADRLGKAARLWAVVLLFNLIGAAVFAVAASTNGLFDAGVHHAMDAVAGEAFKDSALRTMLLAVVAGWLIALMAWLTPAAGEMTTLVIVIFTYIVGIMGLPHVIAGAVEVIYAGIQGLASWDRVFAEYLLPSLIGNVIGGVLLTSTLAHLQVTAGSPAPHEREN